MATAKQYALAFVEVPYEGTVSSAIVAAYTIKEAQPKCRIIGIYADKELEKKYVNSPMRLPSGENIRLENITSDIIKTWLERAR